LKGERSRRCAQCGSPLAGDQRYCLACGERTGERGEPLERLIHSAVEGWPPAAADRAPISSPVGPAAPLPAPARGSWVPVLRPPSPLVSAALVSAFLGFGALIGAAAGSPASGTPAASRAPLKLVLPASHPAAGTSSTPSSTGSSASGEAPASEPEPTPASSPSTTASAAKPAAAPAEGSGSSSGEGGNESSSGSAATELPPFKHVFLITLSDEPYASAFGPVSSAHYLTSLEQRGELLVHYDAVAHEELANGVALLSGQGPTAETAANCPAYGDITPATPAASEQVLGSGCIYPRSTQTLPGELSARHLSWRAYVEGIDEPGAQAGACAHPTAGAPDPTSLQTASTGPYATFRNPLVYFHSILDSSACASGDVGLSALKGDLASASRTPSFSYIVPDRCHDGNPTPCTPGAPAGMSPADTFLKTVVPEITSSKAYAQGGLLVITVDQAPSSGEFGDSSSCCGQPSFPNAPAGATAGRSPRGGGAVGALLLSRYVKGATTSQEPFNHFSLLRTIEDIFSLKHLGYAALAEVKPLAPALFTASPSG